MSSAGNDLVLAAILGTQPVDVSKRRGERKP
jgi:hypothetical protein